MNPKQRPTPETDEAEIKQNVANQAIADKDWPWQAIKSGWDFARQLERQRDEAREEIEAMREELADIRQRLKGHSDSQLAGENGLAAATMRGFELQEQQLEDLNACAELEASLSNTEFKRYRRHLNKLCNPSNGSIPSTRELICAKPNQRRLAYFKTKGILP